VYAKSKFSTKQLKKLRPKDLDMVGTYPRCHAQMLAKVPKTPPKYPKPHA
jgi:hypothetical protein